MAKFWISYRLKRNSTYEKRYDDLMEAIDDCCTGERWEETTSFHMIESTLTIDSATRKLKAAINTTTDVILVREVDTKSARFIGAVSDEAGLKRFMSYASRA